MTDRPKFVLTLEALPRVDAIKALRFVLKRLIRQYGLKCVDLYEVKANSENEEKVK
jgi:hypothetical protein